MSKPQPRIIGQEDIQRWLLAFQKCVRKRDYEKSRELFHSNVIGFGTESKRDNNIVDLDANDWKKAWGNMLAFEFVIKDAGVIPAPGMFVIAIDWLSRSPIYGGSNTNGRATIVLVNFDGKLLCVHSHFSINK